MTRTATAPFARGPLQILRQIDDWLDQRGKWAWIAAMVAGFIIFAPLGLAILGYMIWGKHMFRNCCTSRRKSDTASDSRFSAYGLRPSGNRSFDGYRAETLRRLEEEHEAFEQFLQRLRDARDKKEFDAFMDERAASTRADQENQPAGEVLPVEDEPRRGSY